MRVFAGRRSATPRDRDPANPGRRPTGPALPLTGVLGIRREPRADDMQGWPGRDGSRTRSPRPVLRAKIGAPCSAPRRAPGLALSVSRASLGASAPGLAGYGTHLALAVVHTQIYGL